MAMLDEKFVTEDLPEDSGSFDPLPDGEYSVTIAAAEIKATKDNTGQYIKETLTVTGPTHVGRKLFSNINIRNKSAEAERIGRGQLRAQLTALGINELTDTDQLFGGEMRVKVVVKPADGQYAASNEVKGYAALTGSVATAPAPKQRAAHEEARVASGAPAKKMPWDKN